MSVVTTTARRWDRATPNVSEELSSVPPEDYALVCGTKGDQYGDGPELIGRNRWVSTNHAHEAGRNDAENEDGARHKKLTGDVRVADEDHRPGRRSIRQRPEDQIDPSKAECRDGCPHRQQIHQVSCGRTALLHADVADPDAEHDERYKDADPTHEVSPVAWAQAGRIRCLRFCPNRGRVAVVLAW